MNRYISKFSQNVQQVKQNNLILENDIKTAMNANPTFKEYLDEKDSLFVQNRLINMYKKLKQKEILKKNFLELVEAYEYLPIQAYDQLFRSAYLNFKSKFPEADRVIWLPTTLPNSVRNSSTFHQVKSSDLVMYLVEGTLCYSLEYEKKLPHFRRGSLKIENVVLQSKSDETVVVLVDDFIGSGKQCAGALERYQKLGIKIDAILTLTILESGYQYLSSFFPSSLFIGKKVCTIDDLNITNEQIINLYKNLSIKWDDKNRPTALVSMIRTPNNTLQLFRTPAKFAPFPR